MKLASVTILILAAAAGRAAPPESATPGARKSGIPRTAAEKSADDLTVIESALVTVIEEAEIPAQVEGLLAAVEIREGKMIEAGGVVARIEDAEARLTHERARTEFEIARKQAENDLKVRVARKSTDVAKAELRRAEESVEKFKKSVSDTELDRLRLAAEKAALEIDQAIHEQEVAGLTSRLKEIEMQLARQAVDRRVLTSPISGMVVQVNRHQGEWVQAGKTVVRVLRVDRLRVEGFVPVKQLPGELEGRRVTLTVDLPGKPGTIFGGSVVFVSPEVNPVNGQVRVWAEVENPKLLLRPGIRGSLAIHAAAAQTAKREIVE
jgi:macrolide-specific efflux system membrane fusion protein